MTTYRAISDTEVAVDAPLTQQLMQALKDNEVAVREGDATAPRIDYRALTNAVAGNHRIFPSQLSNGTTANRDRVSEDGVRQIYNVSATTNGSTNTMLRTGTFRFRILYGKESSSGTMNVKLQKNGVTVFTSGTIGSTLETSNTTDQAFDYGDEWRIVLTELSGSIANGYCYVAIGCNTSAASTIGDIVKPNIDGSFL